MTRFARRFGLVFGLAALSSGGLAHAQTAAVPYSNWPMGFQTGNDGPASSASGGYSYNRTDFQNGWFMGAGENSGSLSGIGRIGAFGSGGSVSSQGMQFGYSFQNSPVTLYAGFDSLKYNPGIGSLPAAFDSSSGTVPGYRAHAGIEFQAAPNVSLSLGVGYVQQPGVTGTDINSIASGAAPFAFGARR